MMTDSGHCGGQSNKPPVNILHDVLCVIHERQPSMRFLVIQSALPSA